MKYLLMTFFWLSALSAQEAENITYVDDEGDKITVLDTLVRKKTKTTDEIIASHVSTKDNSKYGNYIVETGDTLGGISSKVYGTVKRWKELEALNKEVLEKKKLVPGLSLIYLLPDN